MPGKERKTPIHWNLLSIPKSSTPMGASKQIRRKHLVMVRIPNKVSRMALTVPLVFDFNSVRI